MDTTGAPLVSQAAIGGPTTSSWREQALTRIAELENLTDVFATQPGLSEPDRRMPVPREELLAETESRIDAWNALGRRLCGTFVEVAERSAVPV